MGYAYCQKYHGFIEEVICGAWAWDGAFLEDPDPTVCGYTVWLLGNLGAHEARKDIQKFLGDSHEIEIYEKGQILKMSLDDIAKAALLKL